MKSYEVNYLFYTYFKPLELDFEKSKLDRTTKLKIEEVASQGQNIPVYFVSLSFKAVDNVEAIRKVAMNTSQSLLIFKGGLNLVSYHIELIEKRWLKNKTIEDQFYIYKSEFAKE